LPRAIGLDPSWGAAGLTASAGIAGWIEFGLLRSRLNARIGSTGLPFRYVVTLWATGLVAGILGFGVKVVAADTHRIVVAILALGVFALVYFGLTSTLGIPESSAVFRRLRGRAR
jgi:putative peptidoglycan lipid II flippase